MPAGTVKWFSDDKGLGFITPDDGGKEFFAHHSNIRMEGYPLLRGGQRVTFDAAEGAGNRAASNIRIA